MTVDDPSLSAAPATQGRFHAFLSHNGADIGISPIADMDAGSKTGLEKQNSIYPKIRSFVLKVGI